MTSTGLVWFRSDLRISDNRALQTALNECERTLAIYISETPSNLRPIGGAARAWLARSLQGLCDDLSAIGIPLHYIEGDSAHALPHFIAEHRIGKVYWNRRYGPAERAHDATIRSRLKQIGVAVESFNGALLVEPWAIATQAGKPFSVFTPFWKALRQKDIPRPIPAPEGTLGIEPPRLNLPALPDWSLPMLAHWQIGERAAQTRFEHFLDVTLSAYQGERDSPAKDSTSALSPYLRFGQISPRQIWHAVCHKIDALPALSGSGKKFLSELAWRDFAHHLLYHRDDITQVPMRDRFSMIEWRNHPDAQRAWQRGQTGVPIVDAGMRQLWQTGWMHNRVRMLTASLLTKNLLIDWRSGEDWFWDTLVDADPANNPASWQWVAGCGSDAAPYFRIFNPVTQGEKFDPDGDYIRRWVPELSALERQYIHRPFDAPKDVLKAAGIKPGETYPEPIVDLKATRERALTVLGQRD